MEKEKILVVDDETTICEILSAFLEDEGFDVKVANNGQKALKLVSEFRPSVVLLDVWMPGDLDGLDVLEQLKSGVYVPKVVVMSGHGTIETAVKAVKLGAWDFVEKPLSMEKVLITIKNILLFNRQENERRGLLNQLRESFTVVGNSPHIQQIKSLIMRLGTTHSPYLLKGEEGVGKELIARNIHFVGKRAGGPFVVANCNALPEGLQMSELWGSEKGSNIGLFKAAEGGTLLIKNIENLEDEPQEALVKFLREKEVARTHDVRVVVTTSVDLGQSIKEGSFREDLYRKLSALSVEIRPLRDHKDDIPILVEYFSETYCRKAGIKYRGFQEDALAALQNHDWPGNVLELKNFVERTHILSSNDEIDIYDVGYAGLPSSSNLDFHGYGNFREARTQFEKDYLLAKIAEHGGNISRTSEAIGLERSYLHRKIKAYGIDVDLKK